MRKSSIFTLSIIFAVCLLSGCASTRGRNHVQLPEDEALSAIEFAMNDVRVPALLFDYIPLQTSVGYVNISWESSNKKICYQNDIWLEVRKQAEETDLTLTATFECSGYTAEKNYQVHVFGEQQVLSDDEIQKLVLEDMIASFMWTGESYSTVSGSISFAPEKTWESEAVTIAVHPQYSIDNPGFEVDGESLEIRVVDVNPAEDTHAAVTGVFRVDIRNNYTGEEHSMTTPAKTVDICVPKSTQF